MAAVFWEDACGLAIREKEIVQKFWEFTTEDTEDTED
jgi:hypothetical protein